MSETTGQRTAYEKKKLLNAHAYELYLNANAGTMTKWIRKND